MRTNYVATALCVLCVFGSAMASQQKMFAELMHEAKAGVASRPSGADGHVDYKHLCLREAKHYHCRTLGCQDIDRCGAAEGCFDCVTGLIFQSDMSCCGSPHDHDEKNYYSAANSVAAGGTGFHSPYLKVGTCDWDITVDSWFQCWADEIHACAVQLNGEPTSMMRRIGTAFATCYLTSGAEYCDDMLCDKMVLRFQGGFYLSGARSYQKSSLYNTAKDQWCGPPIPTDGFLDRRNAGSSNTTREVYTGVALLASGTVSLTSLRKEVEYPVGHMDYVYDFLNIADADIGNIQTRYGLAAGDYPFLTPNTYKMKLVGEKKATYKK